jgi:hypothetical protein
LRCFGDQIFPSPALQVHCTSSIFHNHVNFMSGRSRRGPRSLSLFQGNCFVLSFYILHFIFNFLWKF